MNPLRLTRTSALLLLVVMLCVIPLCPPSALFFVHVVAAHNPPHQQQQYQQTRPTAMLRASTINMSQLLFIPDEVLRSAVDDGLLSATAPAMVETAGDGRKQQEIAARLRSWAEGVLRCSEVVITSSASSPQESSSSSSSASTQHEQASCDGTIHKKCAPLVVHAWNIMGSILQPQQALTLNHPTSSSASSSTLTFKKRSCLFEAVKCDPTYSRAWYNLGLLLAPGGKESFQFRASDDTNNKMRSNKKEFTKRDCFEQAVAASEEGYRWHSDAWYQLGLMVDTGETLRIRNKNFDRKACFVQALSIDPANAYAWNNLANSMVHYYGEIVQLPVSATTAAADNNKNKKRSGVDDDDDDHDVSLSRVDCYIRALELQPTLAVAWYNLGSLLPLSSKVAISGTEYDKKACFMQAFKHGGDGMRQSAHVWNNLGNALLMQQHPSSSSSSLSDDVDDDATTATVDGVKYDKRRCYEQALSMDETLSSAWNNLGSILPNDDVVVVASRHHGGDSGGDGGVVTSKKISCFVNSIKYNPKFATPWANLGDLLRVNETVEIPVVMRGGGGDDGSRKKKTRKFGKKACLVRALRLDPNDSNSWNELGVLLLTQDNSAGTRSARIAEPGSDGARRPGGGGGGGGSEGDAGKRYTPRDCFVKSVEMNPENGRAWYNLGIVLNFTEMVEVAPPPSSSSLQQPDDSSVVATKSGDDDPAAPGKNRKTKSTKNLYHAMDCFRKAIELSNGQHCESWTALGNALDDMMPGAGTTFVLGKMVDKKGCYIETILCSSRENRHDVANNKNKNNNNKKQNKKVLSSAWHNLGVTLHDIKKDHKRNPSRETPAQVGDLGAFTRAQCFVQALEADETNVDAWFNLASLMRQEEVVVVRGERFDKTAVLARYDELRPRGKEEDDVKASLMREVGKNDDGGGDL